MARGKAHPDQTRAAVMAALLEGQSVTSVAKQYQLSKSTVIKWRDAAGIGTTQVQPEKKSEIGDLIVDYLREILTTLSVQVRAFRDEDWLKKQSADQAAVLHGVLTDKAVRLLEAIDGDESDAPADVP